MWIFGYGSLIWKVDFPYERKLVGFIKGYSRRFWQGSEDHRGIPGKPGRVVTLVVSDEAEEQVWGVAYEISAAQEESVRRHLDYREKGGYEMLSTTFYPCHEEDNAPPLFSVNIYVGTVDNPHFLGPASVGDIAMQICNAVGPSGSNIEYLFQLADAMKSIAPPGVCDKHLVELESAVREIHLQSDL